MKYDGFTERPRGSVPAEFFQPLPDDELRAWDQPYEPPKPTRLGSPGTRRM